MGRSKIRGPVARAGTACRAALLGALVVSLGRGAMAGPPFVTDDPEPVEWRHWEIYLASQGSRDDLGWSGTAPHVELNYGLVPEVQVHVIAPWVLTVHDHGRSRFGYGDTETGIKLRFVRETSRRPQVGTFPILDLATGSASAGTGAGHGRLFLPLWVQKSHGAWTTYGGGGYATGLGADRSHSWLLSWEVQRQVTSVLTVGGEFFHAAAPGGEPASESAFDLGLILDLSPRHHLLLSVGRDLSGPVRFQEYAGWQLTWGPAASE